MMRIGKGRNRRLARRLEQGTVTVEWNRVIAMEILGTD